MGNNLVSLFRISLIARSGKMESGTTGNQGEVDGTGGYAGDGDTVSSHPHCPSWPQTAQAAYSLPAPAVGAELLNSTGPRKGSLLV